jgi:LEA14-like dessication related protein
MTSRRLVASALAAFCLAALPGCNNPAAAYRAAARQLKFSLDRVEPSLQLAYPLEKSRLGLRLTLSADNPTTTHFKARTITGGISLDSDGASHTIGQLSFAKGVDLKPASRTPVVVELAFGYNDLRTSWVALRNVGGGHRPGTWRLDGQVGLEVLGSTLTVPLRVQKHVSGQ